MHGFKEDLLNVVASDIAENWERYNGDINYFVGKVKGARLTPEDLDWYLHEHGDSCHEGVNNVFAAIVYANFTGIPKYQMPKSAKAEVYIPKQLREARKTNESETKKGGEL